MGFKHCYQALHFIGIIFLLFINFSCGKNLKKEASPYNKFKADIILLQKKYNAISDWDTLKFSYQIDQIFKDSSKMVMLHDFISISDIFYRDDKYYLSGSSGLINKFHFCLAITEEQRDMLSTRNTNYDLAIVAKVQRFQKIRLRIDVDTYYEEILNEDGDTISEEEFSLLIEQNMVGKNFLITGTAIDFLIKE